MSDGKVVPFPQSPESTAATEIVVADCCTGRKESVCLRIDGCWYLFIAAPDRMVGDETRWRCIGMKDVTHCPLCGGELATAPTRNYHDTFEPFNEMVEKIVNES